MINSLELIIGAGEQGVGKSKAPMQTGLSKQTPGKRKRDCGVQEKKRIVRDYYKASVVKLDKRN